MTASVILGVIMSIVVPFLGEHASAATSNSINLIRRGANTAPSGENVEYGTCTPYFTKELKTESFLNDQFYSETGRLPYDEDPQRLRNLYTGDGDFWNLGRNIESKLGTFHGAGQFPDADNIVYVLQYKGQQRPPVIRFRPATNGNQPLHYQYSPNDTCNNMVMIPIENGIWRGFQTFNNRENSSASPDGKRALYMEFRQTGEAGDNVVGDVTYWTMGQAGDGRIRLGQYRTSGGDKLIVEGKPDYSEMGRGSPGGSGNVGTVNARWVDAATITINSERVNGEFAGEVYKKRSWKEHNGYAYYFLETASPGRENLTWANNSKKCEEALPLSSACGGGGICVPFVAVKAKLNVSANDQNLDTLKNNISQLGGSDAQLYNFNAETCLQRGSAHPVALSDRDNARIWLYYSSTNKAFLPVFTTGEGNERPYIGQYAEAEAPQYGSGGLQRNGVYKYGECVATISSAPTGDRFGANWTLTDGNCRSLRTYGTLNVLAMGGSAGETAFSTALTDGQSTIDAGDGEARFICSLSTGGVLSFNWIFCPLTRLALEGIDALEAVINDTLTLKTNRIFTDNFFQAWAGFRTLALALIAIAALIMVISQAAGLEILDAYTIKKVLPRLLFAAIAITVSWAVMQFLVTLSNDVGSGIRYLIYSPFPNENDLGGVAFTGFLVALLSSGALLAFGLLGMLSFILTALLAAAVAFCIIVFRELLVMFLVMSAPFAIACYILPNTQKVWEWWKNAFMAALLVFAIISAFIALGRVFAIVAVQSGGNETLNQIIAIVAYILPYFLITTAFRLAGGVMSTVGGFINDRTRGGFDRLRNFRGNQLEDRGRRFREGRLYDSNNLLMRPGRRGPLGTFASAANNLGDRVGVGRRGAFGFGERGRQATALRTFAEAEEERKNPLINALANTDDAGMLVLAASGGNARRARQFVDQRISSGKWNAQQGEEAYNAAMAVGVNRGTSIASLQKLAENKSREIDPGDVMTIRRAIADVSEGNTVLADKLSYDFQFRSRTSGGRTDLGGVWHTPEKRLEANGLAASMARVGGATDYQGNALTTPQAIGDNALGVVAYFDGVDRTSVQQALAGHPSEVKQMHHAVKTALKYGTDKQREEAALVAYEAFKGLSAGQASASNRKVLAEMMSDLGVDSESLQRQGVTVEEALALKVGTDPIQARDIAGNKLTNPATGQPLHYAYTATTLTNRARAWGMNDQRNMSQD